MVILKDDPSVHFIRSKNKVKHERLNATYIIKNKHI